MSDETRCEVKPAGYLDDPAVKGLRCMARVVVGRHDRRLAAPVPEFPASPDQDLTGRYESEDGTVTFLVNQAGKFVTCWASRVIDPKQRDGGVQVAVPGGETFAIRPVVFMNGEQQGDGSFEVWIEDRWQDGQGTLRRSGAGAELELRPTGGTPYSVSLRRLSPAPTFSRHALAQLPVGMFWKHEWTPLTSAQRETLHRLLAPEKLVPYFQDYVAAGTGTGAAREARQGGVVLKLDQYIREVFANALDGVDRTARGATPPRWHYTDLELARFHARALLARQVWGAPRRAPESFLGWILTMVLATSAPSVENIAKHLGIRRPPVSRKGARDSNCYRFKVGVAGWSGDLKAIVGGGAGAFVGGISVSQVKSLEAADKDTLPIWSQDYLFVIANGSLGAGIGGAITLGSYNEGEASSPHHWQREHFPGWATAFSTEAGGMAGVAGAKYGGEAMLIYGTGDHPPLTADMGGWTYEAGVGAQAGGSGVAKVGYIILAPKHTIPVRPSTEVRIKTEYLVEFSAEPRGTFHFKLGSAILTPQAWRAVRVFCARERAVLSSAASILAIVGHADTLDTEARNKALSELRVKNTLQAIRDILGPALAIPDAQIDAVGLGEAMAREAAGIQDDQTAKPAPEWRKVDVVLNNRLVLTLRAEGLLPPKAPAPQPAPPKHFWRRPGGT